MVVAAAAVVAHQATAYSPAPQDSLRSLKLAPAPTAALVFQHVTVVDMTDGHLLPEQTVVVLGNRIRAVGSAAKIPVPAGAQVVDGRGRYLIPGFWDMHAHVDQYVNNYPKLIASGVTGIREMAQRFKGGIDSFRVWQQEVMVGTRVGPRSIGPSVDLTNPHAAYGGEKTQSSGYFPVPDTMDAPYVMEAIKEAGIKFVKHHNFGTDRNLFFAMLRAARKEGLSFIGHIPQAVTNVEASDSGMRSVEHINEHRYCWVQEYLPLPDSATTKKLCAPTVEAYVKNGTWMTPTLVAFFPDQDSPGREFYPNYEKLVRTMHSIGLKRFLAGSDFSIFRKRRIPGFSILEEVILLARAGLSPLEALQAATLNPAKYLEATDSLGTVASGKIADLVLLDGDPLADIRQVLQIRAVVANGRYFDRAALDALDPDLPKHHRQFAGDEATLAAVEEKVKGQPPTPAPPE